MAFTTGQTLTLTRPLGGKHTRYQWQRQVNGGWQDLAGQTDSVYQLATADATAEGLYRTRATNDWVTGLTLTSKPIYALAKAGCLPPKLPVSAATTVQAGDAVNLRAYPDPIAASLQWNVSSGPVLGTSPTLVVTPTKTTTYTVTATTGTGCVTKATIKVTVVPAPPLRNPPVAGSCAPKITTPRPAKRTGPDPVNYVRTFVPRVAITNAADVSMSASKEAVQIKTEYLDGLGRPVQTVLRAESPLGNDIVQPVAYDALGRQPRQYLPYVAAPATSQAGGYRPNALYEQDDFYRSSNVAGPGLLTDGIARTGVAYAQQEFEASPLNRVRRQGAPGESWALSAGHAVGRDERPNTAADAVPRFAAGYDPAPHTLSYQGDYPAGELWLTQTTDEHGRLTQELQDKQGQVVAKKVEEAAGQWLTTVYVYDDFQRLRAVLPPKATRLLAQGSQQITPAVEELLFRYRYDARGRVAAKQVPGQVGETQLVYDLLDRPILSQDPQQRGRNEWAWTKYDALGRVVLTGLLTRTGATQTSLQAAAVNWLTAGASGYNASNRAYEQPSGTRLAVAGTSQQPVYYSGKQSYPALGSTDQLFTVTYYDDYNYDRTGGPDASFDNQYAAQFASGPVPAADPRVTGLPTRTLTRVLGAAAGSAGEWLTTTSFYDERARPVQVVSTNARGGQDVITSQLDFAGKVLSSYSVHTGPNHEPIQIKETFAYDHAGRLLEVRQQLPGEAAPTIVAQHRYTELGQLLQKTLAPGSALAQRLDYGYNIRGWLTGLNEAFVTGAPTDGKALWGMQLSYDCGFTVKQYNGNISGQQWRSQGDGVARAYGYLYDGASRLTGPDYVARQPGSSGLWKAEQQRYGLPQVRYDENGNILALERRGLLALATRTQPAQFGPTDKLTYQYQGNRLVAVEDAVSGNALPQAAGAAGALVSLAGDFQEKAHAASEYNYDQNGNLTADANKGITRIVYNYLNLAERIEFGAANYLEFGYSAAGQKVRKRVVQAGQAAVQTDYLGAYQYEGDSLRFFAHAEGRVLRFVSPVSGAVRHEREYSLKDHLGNLRVAYRLGTPATYTATLEPDQAKREQSQFDSASIASTRFQTPLARTRQYAARLNAGQGQPLGPMKLLAVHKGDTVRVLAPGLYPQAVSQPGFSFSLLSFVATLLQPPPTGPVPDGRPRARALPFLGLGLGLVPALTATKGVPKGYVRMLVYNQDSVLVESKTQQLDETALNNYQELRLSVVAPSEGYVTVYVGNESNVDVFFDDVEVRYDPAILVQENHYDPWGLNLAGLERTGGQPVNQYLYNGKEKQNELGLGWSDYGARMYDAVLGRFHTPDKFTDKYIDFTPYHYGGNNPALLIDINGDSLAIFKNGTWVTTIDDGKKEITGFNQRTTTNKKGETEFTGADNFKFNDYEDDMKGIKSGEITLRSVSDSEINGFINESGVNESENKEKSWSYIERESRPIGNNAWLSDEKSKGRMDYTKYTGRNFNKINIIDGIGYNANDYGNFLWGLGGRKLGFSYRTLQAAAHVNNAFNSRTDNPDKDYSVFDSPGDQRAIKNGYNYWQKKPKGSPRE